MSVGSVAGHWLFSRRRWLNPADDDDRRALEEGYHRLCDMLPAFKACLLSTFLQVLGKTVETWARRASECWANHKIVVFTPRPGQSTTDHVGSAEAGHESAVRRGVAVPDYDAASRSTRDQAPTGGFRDDRAAAASNRLQAQAMGGAEGSIGACGSEYGDDTADDSDMVGAEEALHRSPHRYLDWLADSDCDDSDTDESSTDMGGDVGGENPSSSSRRRECDRLAAAGAGPEDAMAMQLLEYTRSSTAAAEVGAQQLEGTAGDMDAVLESMTGLCAAAEEIEEWARSRSF